MITTSMIFNRELRPYSFIPTASLWYEGKIHGFRIASYLTDTKPLQRKHQHYDMSTLIIDNLGFLGVPETYYGLENSPALPMIEHKGRLTTQEEINKELGVIQLTEPFVIAYLLKVHLFRGYNVYEGKSLISPSRRVVILHKVLCLGSVESLEVECTLYYGKAEKETIFEKVGSHSIYSSDLKEAHHRDDGSISFWISLYELGSFLTDFGGLYTTAGIWHICTHFAWVDRSIKDTDTVCYAPKNNSVLWKRLRKRESHKLWKSCIEELRFQLKDKEYVVL